MSAIDILRRKELQEKRRSVALLLKQPRVSQLRELFERNGRSRDDGNSPLRRKEHASAAVPQILNHVVESRIEGVEGALAALEGTTEQNEVVEHEAFELSNRQRTNSTLSNASNSTDSTETSRDADVEDLSEPELDDILKKFAEYAERAGIRVGGLPS